MAVSSLWVVYARGEGAGRYGSRCLRSAHVVGVVEPGAACGRRRGAPAIAMDVVVVSVAAVEVRVVVVACEG